MEFRLDGYKQSQSRFLFQSLFFWIWNSDKLTAIYPALFYKVSILVFLDMEFRHQIRIATRQNKRGFNPCFSGYGIQTNIISTIVSPLKVSILVFLDMEFRQTVQNIWQISYQSFNPCFSGYGIQTSFVAAITIKIISFNPCFSGYGIQTYSARSKVTSAFGFNPCFSGYGIQTRLNRPADLISFVFQSLFFWIWNSDTTTKGRRHI